MATPFDPMVRARHQQYRQHQERGNDNRNDERAQKTNPGVPAAEAGQYADENVHNRFDHGAKISSMSRRPASSGQLRP
jgi:hypothetical protein